MKKILLTWANGMLASDFFKYSGNDFEILPYSRLELDITNLKQVKKILSETKPDVVLNCAAYTAVDDAEDIWVKLCFDINALWVYNLAKITNELSIDFINISTDYVFEWEKKWLYDENDECNPINNYWLSKYLWEKLSLQENKNSINIRTSWLYGWWENFKNFVNTMLKISETRNELKVVNDQFWLPTYTKDLSLAIWEVIKKIENFRWNIFHFSNSSTKAITWFDFASEIFKLYPKEINLIPCSSQDFITKAKRPAFSLMVNNSDIKLRDWKEGLRDYLSNL